MSMSVTRTYFLFMKKIVKHILRPKSTFKKIRNAGGIIQSFKKVRNSFKKLNPNAYRASARSRFFSFEQSPQKTGFSPKVSVIVPNFNHASFLEERLESIYSQTYKNYEVILLDDCSQDDSVDILLKYKNLHPSRTKLYLNTTNSGSPFPQWKKGIEAAEGDIIWIAESDDYCDATFLEKLVPFFENDAVMLAYSDTKFVQDGDVSWTLQEYLADVDPTIWKKPFVHTAYQHVINCMYLKNTIPNVSSALIRNTKHFPLLNDKKWLSLSLCADWIFYLDVIKGGHIAYTNHTSNYHRVHASSTTGLVQQTLRYFSEHQIVAEYLVSLYRIDFAKLDVLRDRLIECWKNERNDFTLELFSEHFSTSHLCDVSKTRKPHIIMAIYALCTGGGETFPIFLANSLKQEGYTVSVLNFAKQEQNDGVRDLLLPSIPLITLSSSCNLADAVNAIGGDIIHSHHMGVDVEIAHSRQYFTHCKHIITMHGGYECISVEDFSYASEYIIPNADTIVYTADKNLDLFKKGDLLTKNTFVKINNGLERSSISAITRAELNIPEDAFVLCLVSRALPEKGWQEAADAVDYANSVCKRKVYLVLIGDGYMHDKLASNTSEFVHCLGFKSNIRDYFAMSDMGFLPSRFPGESFPLVIIDCLFAGRPVLASNVGEIPKMLSGANDKSAGIVFSLEDGKIPVKKLGEIIADIAENGDLYQEMLAEVPVIAEKFDIKQTMLEYCKCYARVYHS